MAFAEAVLRIEDLRTYFHTDAGVVRAVNGVTLSVAEGETLAIVGESGSGKSVTGLTIMRLLARTPGRVEGGSIRFRARDGKVVNLLDLSEDRMAELRGRDIAMIFQDPMSSLNPVFSVGDQIAESIRIHHRATRAGGPYAGHRPPAPSRHHRPGVARRRLPASALRRNAPACHDCDRARLRPEAPYCRRADDRPRCHHPGADHRAAARRSSASATWR